MRNPIKLPPRSISHASRPHPIIARNVGSYPRHHFAYHASSAGTTDYPLTVLFAGGDDWIEGCYRERPVSEVFCLELVVSGQMRFQQDGREYTVGPGELFLVRKHCHSIMETGPGASCHKIAMALDGPLLDSLLRATGLWGADVVQLENPARLRRHMMRSFRLLKNRPLGYVGQLSLLAYSVVTELARERARAAIPAALPLALEFMQSRLAGRLSAKDLARQAGVSGATLTRLFRRHLGNSPIGHFLEMKMEAACSLLGGTSLSVKEIAYRLGYEDPLYFSAEFRKRLGSSPTSYRRTHGRQLY